MPLSLLFRTPLSRFPLTFIGRVLLAGWLVTALGCIDSESVTPPESRIEKSAPDPLKVLVVGETGIGPKLARQWKSRMDGELTIVDQPLAQWIADGFPIAPETDLVIYPPGFVGELSEKQKIVPLEYSIWSSVQIDRESYLSQYEHTIVRYGNQQLGLPLGNPHLAMIFDRVQLSDSLKDDQLPTTWQALSDVFGRANQQIEFPLKQGWAGHTFISRIASSTRSAGSFSVLFDRSTMQPQITAAPFVAALESLHQLASPASLDSTPSDTFRAVIDGSSVAALGWPAKSTDEVVKTPSDQQSDRGTYVVVSTLSDDRIYDFHRRVWKVRNPNDDGQVETVGFSGLMVSLVAESRHEYSALEFIKWLAEPKITLSVAGDCSLTGPVRVSHLGNIGRWAGDDLAFDLADDYGSVIRQIHQCNLVVTFPRIPGRQRYYDALDTGVRAAVAGDQTATEALQSIADQWNEITDSLGREKQIQAMRHDSGF